MSKMSTVLTNLRETQQKLQHELLVIRIRKESVERELEKVETALVLFNEALKPEPEPEVPVDGVDHPVPQSEEVAE